MKITHLNPALTKGGAEKVLVDLANLAARQGHEVSIVSAIAVDPVLLQDQVDPRVKLHFVCPIGGDKNAAYGRRGDSHNACRHHGTPARRGSRGARG